MPYEVRGVEYYYSTVKNQPGSGHQLLARLADLGVNLLGFSAVPVGPTTTQLTLFPETSAVLIEAAETTGLVLDGPHPALLVRGDDELGAFAGVHAKLAEANIDVYASSGVADGRGRYGYLLYVRPEDQEAALSALGV